MMNILKTNFSCLFPLNQLEGTHQKAAVYTWRRDRRRPNPHSSRGVCDRVGLNRWRWRDPTRLGNPWSICRHVFDERRLSQGLNASLALKKKYNNYNFIGLGRSIGLCAFWGFGGLTKGTRFPKRDPHVYVLSWRYWRRFGSYNGRAKFFHH